MSYMTPVVVGLDLSLNGTGIAYADGSTETYAPAANKSSNYSLDRFTEIRDHVLRLVPIDVELVMIESLAFDAHDTNRWQAQLTGIVRQALFDSDVAFMTAAPSQIKKYATGSGRATKGEVLRAAQKRLDYPGISYDEADALWLRAIGWALLEQPLVALPAIHIDALRLLRQQRPARRA